MTNTFVVDNSQVLGSPCRAILGYKNVLSSNTALKYEDQNYPLSLAFDNSYATEFSPDLNANPGAGTASVVEFFFNSIQSIDYFLICSKNAGSCGLSMHVKVYRASTASYVTVANFGSMKDGKPVMVYFGDQFTFGYADAIRLRIEFTYTSKPYIMTMMAGKAIVFPRTMSTGLQTAFASYLDEVEQIYADDGLNIIAGRRLARGKQLKGSINYVKMTTVKSFWDDFANHVLNSKPFGLLWNTKLPDEVIYGVQNPSTLTKPTYKNSTFAQLDFEVIGWA